MADNVDDISQKGRIKRLVREWRKKVNEINQKYSKPRLKMTPLVRVSLLALRIYLIILVIILIYKFYTLVR
ncbi:hypothetical protein [Methanosarcina sp. UBA5]|uniref:hypothetical protein n=1 Tax=Methanosarcina sp. UBA5 TaxID=1915593 RepID=UPI0025E9053F|nr:hypothetical protein [Methanosarcina sp. UBA5]